MNNPYKQIDLGGQKVAKSKKYTPKMGAEYSNNMKSRYAEKVRPSGKIYSKLDRRKNREVYKMEEDSKENKFEEAKFHGGCLCGAVRFEIFELMRQIINCHCGQCRHTHGHYAAYSSVEKSKFKFISDTGLKWFRSSNKARRGFCQECGASLFFDRIGEKNISIAAGMLDSTAGLKTISHIFMSEKPDYYVIDDKLPKYNESFEIVL